MTEENHLALIVALFLSKFDVHSYEVLGYKSWVQAFADIGDRLGAKPNTIKQMREQFDPLFPNSRVGWHQRPLSPTRTRVVEEFGGLSFEAYAMLVRSMLRLEKEAVELNQATLFLTKQKQVESIVSEEDQIADELSTQTRGKTGRIAETYFMELFNAAQLPFEGELVDRRDDGCGYDFLIKGDTQHAVEVKGLAQPKGGLLFTNKEWETSRKISSYSVFLAFNLQAQKMDWGRKIIPASQLNGGVQIVQTVTQVNWRFTPDWK